MSSTSANQTKPEKKRGGMLTSGELSAFCTQVAMFLKSGIAVSEGLAIMADDLKANQGKDILQALHEDVDSGLTLATALRNSGHFPKYMIDMTEIGEETGRLDDVMNSLVDYYDQEESISRSIKHAVTYPIIMIVMMVLVIGVLIVKVLPIFNQVFQQLGSEMTSFSQGVMNLGSTLGNYSVGIIIVLVVLAMALLIMNETEGGRRVFKRLRSSFFLTRKLSDKIASGRFAAAMSLMLSSGLDTDQSLEMVHNLVDNTYLQKKIDACKVAIAEGASFADALVNANIFTGVYGRMVTVGFKTGSVDTVMKKLSDRYEDEIGNQIANIISILEPTLVAVLSIIVGMILLSVMFPLMGIMSSIG